MEEIRDNGWFNRVLKERDELAEKVTKLRSFITDEDKFNSVSEQDQEDLKIQLQAMETYLTTIERRIGREESRRVLTIK